MLVLVFGLGLEGLAPGTVHDDAVPGANAGRDLHRVFERLNHDLVPLAPRADHETGAHHLPRPAARGAPVVRRGGGWVVLGLC